MTASPVALAPPQYAGASPRPDLMQAAGSYALAAAAPGAMPQVVYDATFLQNRIEDFESAEDGSRKAREGAERDTDYYHSKQWTEEAARELRKRGQPVIVQNMIRQKVEFLHGLERVQRTRPQALPRTPQHQEDAHACTDALTFVAEDNDYSRIRSKVWADILIAGWGGVEVVVEPVANAKPGRPQMRIVKRRCQWDRMFWDPFSAEDDFSDASFLGMVLWMDRKEAVRRYGTGAGQVYDETVHSAQVGGTYDDKPKLTTWVMHGKRQRVRIVLEYYKDDNGEWSFCEFTKGGILKAGPSPWLNQEGERVHPFEWRSAYVDRDNVRYGIIRDLVDMQDEINKRRSKALHHFTARQTFGDATAQGGLTVRELRTQLARPDGHVQLPPNAKWGENFGIIPTNDQAAGHFEMMQQAMSMFQIMGPNAAMQGKDERSLSGRALQAMQQGGSVQMGALTDTLRHLDVAVFRKVWDRIRQYWTGETWIRVTDDERNLRWVGLNRPAAQPLMDPWTGQPVIDGATGAPATEEIVQANVAELDVDIMIEDAPDMGTLQDEEFESLVMLKQMDRRDEIPLRALIAAKPNLRRKAELLKAMDEREQQNQQVQAMQAQDPLRQAGVAAELRNVEADTAQKAANARKSEAQATQLLTGAQVQAMQAAMGGLGMGGF